MLRPCSTWLLIAALAGAGAGSVTEAIGAPVVVLSRIADQSTTIPGESVPFVFLSGFRCCGKYAAPAVSAGNVAFWGAGSGEQPPTQQGIYALRYGVLGKIADTNSLVPGGTGTFYEFAGNPAISGGNVAFGGVDRSFQTGIYATGPAPVWPASPIKIAGGLAVQISGQNLSFGGGAVYETLITDPFVLPSPIKIADGSTPVPGGTGTFSGLGSTAIGGTTVAFDAAGGGVEGIYAGKPGGPLALAVDTHTAIPGSTGNFYQLGVYSFDGANIGFLGYGPPVAFPAVRLSGVYTVALPPDLVGIPPLVKVADTTTPVPGSSASFYGFGYVAIDRGYVVFEGLSVQNGINVHGLYTNVTGTLTKLIDTTDTIDGKKLEFLTFGSGGFSGTQAVFAADFTDFSTAIVSATVTGNSCPLTPGYWRSHASAWPANTLILGNQSYSKSELLALLNTPIHGDASLVLARELIASKLNVLNFASPVPVVTATTAHADGALAKFAGKLPYHAKLSTSAGSAMLSDATVLFKYNLGWFKPRCLWH